MVDVERCAVEEVEWVVGEWKYRRVSIYWGGFFGGWRGLGSGSFVNRFFSDFGINFKLKKKCIKVVVGFRVLFRESWV